jgi:hypothetical protein
MNKLAIFNMAISLVGGGQTLASLDQKSQERDQCVLWWEPSRDWVFSYAFWPEVRRTAALALVAERDLESPWTSGDPSPHYRYSYALPLNFRRAREVLPPEVDEAYYRREPPIKFALTEGKIHTNQKDAVLVYTATQEEPAEWPAPLAVAVAHKLAENISMALAVSPEVKREVAASALSHIQEAAVFGANSEANQLSDHDGEILHARAGYFPREVWPPHA